MKKPSPLTPLPQSRERGTRILLVGGRGAGKTTVGRLLADKLAWQFTDLDDEIVREAGQSIVSIFESRGESAFRRLEADALVRLISSPGTVIATGGGVVVDESNRQLLKQSGLVVWLKATPEVMYQRIADDPSTPNRRPNLTPIGGLAEMKLVLSEREPLYREVADLIVDTSDLSPDGVVSTILAAC